MIIPAAVALTVALAACGGSPSSGSAASPADRARTVLSPSNPLASLSNDSIYELGRLTCGAVSDSSGGHALRRIAENNDDATRPQSGDGRSVPVMNTTQTLEAMKAVVTFYCAEKLQYLPW
ncbi:MAG: hypothetical protein ABS81_11100 [Pseudonocardia sp. SCN 72-86]|nr:MAG: hypothetical protein ABS81_11100 [Pseudonocardia sp. SCN 72-86]